MTSATTEPSWQRLLYVKQDFPDNYVDTSFLQQMRRNVHVRPLSFWTVVFETTAVSSQFSAVLLFVGVFMQLYEDMLSPMTLVVGSSCVSLLGYLVWDGFLQPREIPGAPSLVDGSTRWRIIQSASLLTLILLGLAPMLKTLTKDIASDSIWALTTLMLLANLAFHDYGSTKSVSVEFPDSLSINAAIFASVLLASRLPLNLHVFSLMSLSVQLFALFPIFNRYLRNKSPLGSILLSLGLVILTVLFFLPVNVFVVYFYVIGILFITFGGPGLLIWIQQYKSEIRGPWDEAVIRRPMSFRRKNL